MFCGDHFGVTPDLLTGAKGVAGGFPAGVVFVREDIAANVKVGEQGTTFGGGPLACAAIAATARTIREEGLAAAASRVGAVWRGALGDVGGVVSTAGLGLMIGVNLDRPAKPVIAALLEKGFLVGSCEAMPNQIRLLPPLVITEIQAKTLTAALGAVLSSSHSGAPARP
jgi:acetylornithine/succinyldiaminopimelate/putrescine aminotransferase